MGPGDRIDIALYTRKRRLDLLGTGRAARLGLDDQRVLEEGSVARDGRELLGELAEGQVQRAPLDQAEGGRVPEGGRAAVAERDLVALGQREQLGKTRANLAHEPLDGLLAVGGSHQRRAVAGQALERLGPHLRGTAAEAPVGGLQLGGYFKLGVLRLRIRRHGASSRSVDDRRMPRRAARLLVAPRW